MASRSSNSNSVTRQLISAPRRISPARWLSDGSDAHEHGHSSGDASRHPWQVVLRSKAGVVVLYNRSNKSLAIEGPASSSSGSQNVFQDEVETVDLHDEDGLSADPTFGGCPLCRRPFTSTSRRPSGTARRPSLAGRSVHQLPLLTAAPDNEHLSTDYFQLLSESHHGSPTWTPDPSRPGTPEIGRSLDASSFLEGYYSRFFIEMANLGRGMSGSVYLCQHVLNGNHLGYFACKKIPVGNSSPSLAKALKEIKHLESLRHPNIVAVHHVWLETAALYTGPPVPCLFALMDYANDGSLDKYIRFRGGLREADEALTASPEELKARARSKRARASSPPSDSRAVHLFSFDEILALGTDITSGLAFLHSKNMLHLDLKAENILLSRSDEDRALIPTAMLSDFGSAEARNAMNRGKRSGTTGTLDYLAPEALASLPNGRAAPHTAELDLWALGLIFHLLAFFRLPYQEADVDALTQEIKLYPGYDNVTSRHKRRDLPEVYTHLIESLVNVDPTRRPSAESVLHSLSLAKAAMSPSFVPPSDFGPSPSGPPGKALVRSKSGKGGTYPRKLYLAASSPTSLNSDSGLLMQDRQASRNSILWLASRVAAAAYMFNAGCPDGLDVGPSLPLSVVLALCIVSLTEIHFACTDLQCLVFTLFTAAASYFGKSRFNRC